jgi:hypothetical protein
MQEGGGVQITILILLNKAIKEQEEVRGAEGGDEVILVLRCCWLVSSRSGRLLAGAEHQANNKAESAAAPSRAPLSFLGNKKAEEAEEEGGKESGGFLVGMLLVGVLEVVAAPVLILLVVVVGGGDEDGHAISMIYVSLLVVVAR